MKGRMRKRGSRRVCQNPEARKDATRERTSLNLSQGKRGSRARHSSSLESSRGHVGVYPAAFPRCLRKILTNLRGTERFETVPAGIRHQTAPHKSIFSQKVLSERLSCRDGSLDAELW
ncbi:hypothetical protein ElyMa_002745300 [Elysia marginata]|uniref:Uncharacterized protein n=1 Tax=Elysia marginata TaxID=1093978 RepID=A0AAV4HJ28_9GAST|nr:hypothetical protein ElyMa_002745300 [Elysia marginata]